VRNWINRSKEKYSRKKVERAGYSFDSKLEAALFDQLKLRERAGEISDLQAQDTIYLTDARIMYKPDFKSILVKTGEPIWHEAKGLELPIWRIKLRLWRHYGPGPLEIWKGHYGKLTLTETVFPKTKIEELSEDQE
jgi:hypothetical protein